MASNNERHRKNRIGSISLAIALAGFLFVAFQPWIPLEKLVLFWGLSLKQVLLSFFEAALVGGIADWFAISALFRHPLGIHLPHTNIIARKKESLAEAVPRFLGGFVQESNIAAELSKVDFVGKLTAFVDIENVQDGIQKWLRERAANAMQEIRENQVHGIVASAFEYVASNVDVPAMFVSVLQWSEKQEVDERILEALAEMFVREIDRKHDFLVDNLTPLIKKNSGWQGLFISSNTVDRFLTGMRDELRAVQRNKSHGLRRFVIDSVRGYGRKLAQPNPAGAERVQLMRFVTDTLRNKDFIDKTSASISDLIRRLGDDLAKGNSTLVSDFGTLVTAFRTRIENDPVLRQRINEGVARVLSGFLTQGHLVQALSGYAAEQLKKTETGEFVARVERAVSNDLQFIRVNGAVVGGLVGLALAVINAFIAAISGRGF